MLRRCSGSQFSRLSACSGGLNDLEAAVMDEILTIKCLDDLPDKVRCVVVKGNATFPKGDHIRREGDFLSSIEGQGFLDADDLAGALKTRSIKVSRDTAHLTKQKRKLQKLLSDVDKTLEGQD